MWCEEKVYLALLICADVSDGEQAGVAARAAEAAHAGQRQRGGAAIGRALAYATLHAAKLRQRLQRAPVDQQQKPEQLRAPTALVNVDPDSAFFLFANLLFNVEIVN